MRFGSTTIPGSLFALARKLMLARETFTPAQMRQAIATEGYSDINAVSDLRPNHSIIADRVMRAAIEELVASGELAQHKRGLWGKPLAGATQA